MYDTFMYKPGESNTFLVECDRRVVGDFIFHLKQYKLRSKIDIEDVSNALTITASWNKSLSEKDEKETISISDNRCDWSMTRSCIPRGFVKLTDDTRIYDTLRI